MCLCLNFTDSTLSSCNLSFNDVGRNEFFGTIPTEVRKLTNLTNINFSKKQIGPCIGDTFNKMLIVIAFVKL